MKKIDPLFAYLSILAVIQPARIQDIESNAHLLLGKDYTEYLIEGGHLRKAHSVAREKKMVLTVRKGVYFSTPKARNLVRTSGLERSIDNRRLFLMKAQRRKYR